MKTLGVAALIGVIVFVAVAVLAVIALVFIVRRLLHGLAYRVVDRAVDKAMDVGVEGVKSLSKNVSTEMKKSNPQRMEADVTRVARQRQGRVAVSDVMAELDLTQPVAERCLEGLARRGVCKMVLEGTSKVYLFATFQKRKNVLACDFCGGSFDDADASAPCPSCGASLVARTIVVE